MAMNDDVRTETRLAAPAPRVTITRVDPQVEHEITGADLLDLLDGLPFPATRAELLAHAEARRARVTNAGDAFAILRRLADTTYPDLRAVNRVLRQVR